MMSGNTEAPTRLTARFAPLPPVASFTREAKSGERVRMPTSSLIDFSFSSFSAEPEVPYGASAKYLRSQDAAHTHT